MNRQTIILASVTTVIIAVAVIVGITQSTPPVATPTVAQQPKNPPLKQLSSAELIEKLAVEKQAIDTALFAAYPRIAELYTINDGRLYETGEWYGTTLTYQGADKANRDTLRVLMQKKNGTWRLLSTPPELLLSIVKYPNVPKSILQSINQPAPLPGTDVSPTID